LGTGAASKYLAGTKVQDIGPSETIPYRDTTTVEQITTTGSGLVELNFVPTKSADVWSLGQGFETTIPTGYGQSNEMEVFVGGYDTSAIWQSNVDYGVGVIVQVGSYTYRCISAHTASTKFSLDSDKWIFFVGNIRLKKHPFKIHNVSVHPESTEGDVQFDADFAVTGASNMLRLTNLLDTGVKVTVVRKTGRLWTGITYNPTPLNLDTGITDVDTGNTTFDQRDATILANSNKNIIDFLKAEPGIWYTNTKS
jgi:hypothetical protein